MLRRLLLLACFLAAMVDVASAQSLVSTRVVAGSLTTNTTSTAKNDIPDGPKTFYGEVVCTSGACAQTQQIYGSSTSTTGNGILLCTLTLSGTTRAQDACPVITASFPWFYIVTTATSGTAATGGVYALY